MYRSLIMKETVEKTYATSTKIMKYSIRFSDNYESA